MSARALTVATPAAPGDKGARGATAAVTAQMLDLSACGIALASVSFDRRPMVAKGVGYVETGAYLRVTLRRPPNERLIEAILRGAPVAVTFSQPTTHRSVQFKARDARLEEPDAEDYAAAERQRGKFSAELLDSAYSAEFTDRYTTFAPHELAVIELRPDDAFDQTPGPAAGARLR